MTRALFLTWDGPDQAYIESLFAPLFQLVQKRGATIDIASMTWADASVTHRWKQAASARGVGLHIARLQRGLGGFVHALTWVDELLRREGVDVLVVRSVIPAALGLLLGRPGLALVYDADGSLPEERADFLGWSKTGVRFTAARAVEDAIVRNAALTITRTQRSRTAMVQRTGVDPDNVVVCGYGRDPLRFSPASPAVRVEARRALGITADEPLLLFVGALGAKSDPALLAALFAAVRRRIGARLLVVSADHKDAASACAAQGLTPWCTFMQVRPDDMPRLLAAADVGLAPMRALPSTAAVAPLKIAEYLLSGLPVVGTRGIGDLEALLGQQPGVCLLHSGTALELERGAAWVVNVALPQRAELAALNRRVGVDLFSSEIAAARFADVVMRADGRR